MNRPARTLVLSALCLLSTLSAAAPSGAAPTTIDALARESGVDAGQGAVVWSRYDEAAKAYRLVVRRGGVNSVPAIATRPVPFDADLGSDAGGNPDVVYSRCASYKDDGGPSDRCDLYMLSLTSGAESRIAGAGTAASESGPTLSHGELAWISQRHGALPAIYQRSLAAPAGRRSTRLPGLPARACNIHGAKPCGRVTDGSIYEIELSGDRLAEIVAYGTPGGGDATEVRLVGVRSRSARRIAFQNIGENGQEYTGLSLQSNELAWHRDCFEYPGCGGSGAYRFGLSTHRYERALDPQTYAGWQWTGDATYTSQLGGHGEDCRPEDSTTPTPCLVLRNADPAWRPIAAGHVR